MCIDGVPEKGFSELLISRSQGFSWEIPKASTHKPAPREDIYRGIAERIDSLAMSKPPVKSGVLWLGQDYPLPDDSEISIADLHEHVRAGHQDDCGCAPFALGAGYVRASDDDKQKQGVKTWVENVLQLMRSAPAFPLCVGWDMDKGSIFTHDREGLWGIFPALTVPGVELYTPELTRLSRCKRCGCMIAFRVGDLAKRIGFRSSWGSVKMADPRDPENFAELATAFALAEKEGETRNRRVIAGLETFAKRGLAARPRETTFHVARLALPSETEYRTRAKRLPCIYEKKARAEKIAIELLDALRVDASWAVLSQIAKCHQVAPDRLVQYIGEALFAGFPDDAGVPQNAPLAVLAFGLIQELRGLVALAVPARPKARETSRAKLEREFGTDGLDYMERRVQGTFCTHAAGEHRICGWTKATKTPSDPHHGGKDVNVCSNPTGGHQMHFPSGRLQLEIDVQRELGACSGCGRRGFKHWKKAWRFGTLGVAETNCDSCGFTSDDDTGATLPSPRSATPPARHDANWF